MGTSSDLRRHPTGTPTVQVRWGISPPEKLQLCGHCTTKPRRVTTGVGLLLRRLGPLGIFLFKTIPMPKSSQTYFWTCIAGYVRIPLFLNRRHFHTVWRGPIPFSYLSFMPPPFGIVMLIGCGNSF
jgi:hypothetical protein